MAFEIGFPFNVSMVCCTFFSGDGGDGSGGFIKNDGAVHPVAKRLAINIKYKANVNLFIFKAPIALVFITDTPGFPES